MVGTPELKKLLACATAGRAKTVLVGDAYQLSPVNARGGTFEQLCTELPWSQRLGEVWRMADPEERDTSLALRAARGNRLRTAIKWYRDHGRLHSGDSIAMAADALEAYLADRAGGRDALLICDTWDMAEALNRRLHDRFASDRPTVTVARDQPVTVGDNIMSRSNNITIRVHPSPDTQDHDRPDQVRNGNRWRVIALDPDTNRIAAERLSDRARVIFNSDYVANHITLGYAATVHSAQGVTADTCYAILGEGASRAMTYVAMTRGRLNNEVFLYQRITNEADHQHATPMSGDAVHISRRDNKHSAAHHLRMILTNDDRPRTMHTEAQRTERHLLPEMVSDLLERHEARRSTRQTLWQDHLRSVEAWRARRERMAATTQRSPGLEIQTDGLEF